MRKKVAKKKVAKKKVEPTREANSRGPAWFDPEEEEEEDDVVDCQSTFIVSGHEIGPIVCPGCNGSKYRDSPSSGEDKTACVTCDGEGRVFEVPAIVRNRVLRHIERISKSGPFTHDQMEDYASLVRRIAAFDGADMLADLRQLLVNNPERSALVLGEASWKYLTPQQREVVYREVMDRWGIRIDS